MKTERRHAPCARASARVSARASASASASASARALHRHPSLRRCVRYLLAAFVICTLPTACADNNQPTTQPTSARQRQEQALRDPYSVGHDEEMYDVSGGGPREFDRKAFKRDWDSFWNP